MRSCIRSVEITASIEEVWSVLATFDDLARWVPEIDHSCLLQPSSAATQVGVGAARRVQLGRNTVVETIVEWSPPNALSYEISGLPPVLRHVRNDWRLREGRRGTTVSLTSTVDAGNRPPQQVVARLVARRLGRTSDAMLAGLSRHLGAAAVGRDDGDAMPQISVGTAS